MSGRVRRANEPVLELAIGAPDDGGPEELRRAAAQAILDGENQYVSSRGTIAFREAVSQHVERFHGLRYAPDREIIHFTGGTEAIFASILGLTEPGDEVLYFSPWYETYRPATLAAGAVPRAIPLRSPGWTFDREDLERVAGPRSRLLILNDPHNPTGRVLTRHELDTIVSFCQDRHLLVVSDQVYEHLVYEGELTPIARYPQMRDRTVAISSTGKTFGLCGWKVGYACAPAPLAERILAVRKLITICSGGPFQSAMAHALAAEDRVFEEIRAALRSRRDFFTAALGELGWNVLPAQAGLFLLFEVPHARFPDAPSFCRWLASSVGILVRPAAHEPDTGTPVRRLVRLAFCKRPETLRQAVERLRQAVSLLDDI
jgi:N-succinyldiaminopimelate aminotransferase